jgi:hypothetical protein
MEREELKAEIWHLLIGIKPVIRRTIPSKEQRFDACTSSYLRIPISTRPPIPSATAIVVDRGLSVRPVTSGANADVVAYKSLND